MTRMLAIVQDVAGPPAVQVIELGRIDFEHDPLGDAWDEPDTGKPPCDFCRREIPCECGPTWLTGRPEDCMCSCGRCRA